jgi:hypothetical protein
MHSQRSMMTGEASALVMDVQKRLESTCPVCAAGRSDVA